FRAAKAYGAGEAQMIFRLGYDPEVIDIGGVTVENFGKRVPLASLPTTQAADRRREKDLAAAAKAAAAATAQSGPVEGGDLRFEIATGSVIRPISPYVYGVNSQKDPGYGATVRRL